MKERAIRINVLSPGAIDTPSLRNALAGDPFRRVQLAPLAEEINHEFSVRADQRDPR
jgi:NAD(P)-dependent dehydrogenase (short-subunit alcohol dehydrogenase family)